MAYFFRKYSFPMKFIINFGNMICSFEKDEHLEIITCFDNMICSFKNMSYSNKITYLEKRGCSKQVNYLAPPSSHRAGRMSEDAGGGWDQYM